MEWNLSEVRTPLHINTNVKQPTLHEIQSLLLREFNQNDRWTERCTEVMESSKTVLFLYDRLEFCLGQAYGADFKILLNPLMLMCYHPSCIRAYSRKSKKPWKLKYILNISCYLKHLKDHSDAVGTAMQIRFNAIHENPFLTADELDSLACSPHSLANITEISNDYLNMYGIYRDFEGNYTCHWKNRLISSKLIQPNSLTFQEDDALIYMTLKYPDPVSNWSTWSTITFYSLKLYAAVSATALSLFRGVTKLRSTGHDCNDLASFVASINHPALSVSCIQRFFPELEYHIQQTHTREKLFHLKLLMKNEESVSLSFDSITRFPVTLGIDDQEINQGAFEHEGKLYGLQKVVNAEEIEVTGLRNIPKYVMEVNKFISSVREYRLTDFKGKFCSNIYTSFENGLSFNGEIANAQLLDVVKISQKCLRCQIADLECVFPTLDKRCGYCERAGYHCISIVVWHVLWDMASAHKKASKLSKNKLDSMSNKDDFLKPIMFTIGFGGLHLAKSPVNCARNHVLSHNGQNFGVNIIRSYKHKSEHLSDVKNSVCLGKDRQSDSLAYMSVSQSVQKFLETQKYYQVVRVPEPILSYKENAKSQKPILFPTSLATNTNGDVFILDSASACVHVVDRSIVAKCYSLPDKRIDKYPSNSVVLGRKVMLTNQLPCMCIGNNTLYISNKGQNEIAVVVNITPAKSVLTACLHLLKIGNCIGMCFANNTLVVLIQKDGISVIKLISFNLPTRKQYSLYLQHTEKVLNPDCELKGLFSVIGSDKVFGGWTNSKKISFYQQKKSNWSEMVTTCSSDCLPSATAKEIVLLNKSKNEITKHKINVSEKNAIGAQTRIVPVLNPVSIILHEDVMFLIQKKNVNYFQLEELGPLDFGLRFCRALQMFYDAIGYIPPKAQRKQNLNMRDSISMASEVVMLFNSMQDSLEGKYPNRHSFTGADGNPASDTIRCFNETVEGWSTLVKRLESFSKELASEVYPHAVTNESMIEHSFGFTKKRGQGHLLTMEEYIQSKRLKQIDFQLQMCQLPFSQTIKSKVRDKGYQELQERGKLNLSIKELKEIFQCTSTETVEREVSDEEIIVLKKALNILKAVPRNSTRTKFRASGNYHPDLLSKDSCDGKLLKGDMVFCFDIENSLSKFVVTEDFPLTNVANKANVKEVGSNKYLKIDITKLVLDQGLILAVPKGLYTILDDVVLFDNAVEEVLENVTCNDNDEEMEEIDADLIGQQPGPSRICQNQDDINDNDAESDVDVRVSISTKRNRLFSISESESDEDENDVPIKHSKSRKKKILPESDEDENNLTNNFNEDNISLEDWVIVNYEGSSFPGVVKKVEQYKVDVSVMVKNAGHGWKWPKDVDQISYLYEEIVCKLPSTCITPYNNRGVFTINSPLLVAWNS